MLKLSACIEMIYSDLPFVERIAQVGRAGLRAFEFWGWEDKDIDAIGEAKDKAGVAVASIVGSGGGDLVDPAQRGAFVQGVGKSIETAHRLGCKTLIIVTGNGRAGVPRAAQHHSIVEGLKQAAPLAEAESVTLALEPLNILVDHKGYYLSTSAEGFQILNEVASPNVKLLYDIYHQQITEGNLIANIEAGIKDIAHFHVADVPGRHEPGTGEINYRNVFKRIDALGYQGYVGLEYGPVADAGDTLRHVMELAS